jgi:flagellar biosynthesis component FlhA
VPSPEAYWRIADQLTNSCDEDLRIAVDRLDHYLDDVLGCAQEDPGDPEFVPCRLTIGSALVPTDRGPGSHLFTELLPAVYQDLESAYGVIVPQVTVTEDPFIGPNEYQIELWGAQIRADEVSPDGPEALTTVTQRFAEELREHLPVLGCIDMTEKLLTRWTADWPELVSQAIGDDIGLVTLNMVLCMLLDRGRSIADGRAVLETFADLGSGEAVTIDELADRCARRLAPAPVPELRS